MNRPYSLNPVCPKFISNKRIFPKIEVRIFDVKEKQSDNLNVIKQTVDLDIFARILF